LIANTKAEEVLLFVAFRPQDPNVPESKHARGQIVAPALSSQECLVSRHRHGQIVAPRKAESKHARGQIVAPVLSGQECLVSRHAHEQIVAPVLSSQEKL